MAASDSFSASSAASLNPLQSNFPDLFFSRFQLRVTGLSRVFARLLIDRFCETIPSWFLGRFSLYNRLIVKVFFKIKISGRLYHTAHPY
jgi:hypothetical protein